MAVESLVYYHQHLQVQNGYYSELSNNHVSSQWVGLQREPALQPPTTSCCAVFAMTLLLVSRFVCSPPLPPGSLPGPSLPEAVDEIKAKLSRCLSQEAPRSELGVTFES